MTIASDSSAKVPLRQDPKRIGQIVFAGIFLLLFIGYFLEALDMPSGDMASPGPGLFPTWIGVAGIGISLWVIGEALLGKGESGAIGFPRGDDLKVAGVFMGTLIGYILVLPYLGMIVSSALYAITFIKFGSHTSWIRSILVGGIMGVVLTLFFTSVLGLTLPRGAWF